MRHARALRRQVHGDDRGLVTVALGLAGRTELSIEAVPPGRGGGRRQLRDALGLLPAGEPVLAAVSPGDARSLRVVLAEGFLPVGSEVVITPGRKRP